MPSVTALLVFLQALGAGLGAFMAVWGELSYLKAARDGKITEGEHAYLNAIAHGLRYGMALLLLSSFGLVVLAYARQDVPQPAVTLSYWMLIALALLVVSVARAFLRRSVSFPIASATLFTAWWFLVYLAFGQLPLTFGAAVAAFLVAAVIFYGILSYIRLLVAYK